MRVRGIAILAFVAVLGVVRPASATPLTFHLSANDVLASVAKTNAFIAALGKNAKGAKLVPGGMKFANQICADIGSVYQLGAVNVLDGPSALPVVVTTRKGRDGEALQAAFTRAGVVNWVPPALDPETNLQFWSASPIARGVRYVSDAVTLGGDAGLIGAAGDPGVLRFRANVTGAPGPDGRYRFLLELYGRTSSNDAPPGGMVVFAERRCFTFVDLEPLDVHALVALVTARVTSSTLRSRLLGQLETVALALERRDTAGAIDGLVLVTSTIVSHVPAKLPPDQARRLTNAVFAVRRGLAFSPITAICGNGMRETGEQCDGGDLGGFNCTSIGFNSGDLSCAADCHFNTSLCLADPVCGNGLLEIGEECDRGDANSDELPDACRTNCVRADCGDHVIDSFEDCEGRDLQGETCVTFGYDGGTLRCDEECEFDDENCTDDFDDH